MALNRTAAQAAKANKATSAAISTAGSAAGLATGIFAAAAGANAVPVAGQVVAAGLAIAGILSKIFVGRRQKKKRQAEERRLREENRAHKAFEEARVVGGAKGAVSAQQGNELVGQTAPVNEPNAPSYGNWGVDRLAVPQDRAPAQDALNNSLGLRK